jgi:hypothetical protein
MVSCKLHERFADTSATSHSGDVSQYTCPESQKEGKNLSEQRFGTPAHMDEGEDAWLGF